MFNRNNNNEELPAWSVKKQKAYKISRIIWVIQIIVALLASVGILIFINR